MNEARQKAALAFFGILIALSMIPAFLINPWFSLLIIVCAYTQNAAYSMVSRAGVRSSYIYYAGATILADITFYTTLRYLVSKDMSLWLAGPYIAATVLGSVTGSKFSMRVESLFKITTQPKDADKDSIPRTIRYALMAILGILVFLTAMNGRNNWKAMLALVALVALKNASFSIVRHSRNTNIPAYHMFASCVDGVLWYFMWKELVLSKMSYVLLPPYMLGNIVGGVLGQKSSMAIGKRIKASADGHLKGEGNTATIPALVMLSFGILFFVFTKGSIAGPAIMFALAAVQSVSFSLVSRSRNRNNTIYHAIASIFSNGIWYFVFRHIVRGDMQTAYAPAFVFGSAFGSLLGVGASMKIEKALGATSDDHVQAKK